MKAWAGEGSLLDLLNKDADVARTLSPQSLSSLFDLDYHLKHVDTIFARVFGD
jgi:adenylosuccinate lyase